MLKTELIVGAAAAADYIGVSRSHVYRLVASGHLPAVRKGDRLYFRKSEIEAAFRSEAA